LLLAMAPQASAANGRQVEVSATGSSPALTYNARNDEFLVVWAERGEEPGNAIAKSLRRPLGGAAFA
jgi:hypothetical protein